MNGETGQKTPYEVIGGEQAVRRFVERFYDLMDSEAAYDKLRAVHAPDLSAMRSSLAGFLSAWLGGPRDWFEQNPGKCMMSAHGSFDIGPDEAEQWTSAMARALADTGVDEALATRINDAFSRMAGGMRRH